MLRLDIPTLAFVTVFITALLGALLVFVGLQNRAVRGPVTWGIAFLLSATGTAMIAVRGAIPDFLSIQVANALVLIGLGLIWSGARQFDGRPARLAMVAIMPAIWIAACAVPFIISNINMRAMVASSLAAILICASACEIWRGRAEPLLSRWPTFLALLLFACVMFGRVPLTYMMPQPTGSYQLTAGALYPMLSFGTLLFAVVLSFLLLNMTKERTELRHKRASLVDPLTDVANRRAFLAEGERLAAQQRSGGLSLTVLLFDLDHFKVINDQFGHAAGDDVLVKFSATATRVLGPQVLFGRIGGEEFGAVLRVASLGEALAIAEQVRFAFTLAGQGGAEIAATVSVGVAVADEAATTKLAAVIADADRALYRAKAKGRNRVACAGLNDTPAAAPADNAECRGWRRQLSASA